MQFHTYNIFFHTCREELFYQMILYEFENLSEIRFETPLSIKELAELALNNKESGWCEQDGSIDELAENVRDALIQKSDMLKEYFSLSITSDGYLETLPLILGNFHDFYFSRNLKQPFINYYYLHVVVILPKCSFLPLYLENFVVHNEILSDAKSFLKKANI